MLNLYNKPIFYFPKFFHPDPSVERRSGFLMPTFGNSKKLGSSVTIPYFHAISESSDFTYKPRFFSETEYLLQSEFRKVTKNSSHIFDVSVNKEKNQNVNGSKTHFFSNSELSIENDFFDESNLNLKIEKVSNDDYTKLYSLESTSPIIKDTNTLESSISYSANTEDIFFDISLESYETMKKTNNDRYEFVYPNYTISKLVEINSALFETINLSSSGSQKKYNTNIYEGVQINDLLLQTKNFISNIGINHEFKTIIKNVNSDGKNSTKYKDNSQSEILNLNSYTISNPLFKEDYDSKNYLTPKLSLRYSPNDTKNIKSESRYLNSGNIFSLNRIGYSDNIEGGSSLTLGLDFKKTDKKENEILNAKIATVFREEKDDNLPTTSTLGKKQSDYVGSVELIPSEFLNFSYDYSINNDFDENNLHDFKTTFKMNNFVNEFVFFEENNLIGDKSYYENTFSYKFDQQNSFSFKTRENKKNNLTEFYKLIYEYKNDCLTASIRYNKEYYSNSTLKPNEELFFNITLIPLGATETESLID